MEAMDLTEEARVVVVVDHVKEITNCFDGGFGIVRIPLEVTAQPKDPPVLFGSNVGCFGHRRFHGFSWVSPIRPQAKHEYALAVDAVAEVKIGTYLFGWPAFFKECLTCLGDFKDLRRS